MTSHQQASPRGALVLGGAHGSLEIARSLGRRGIPVWLIATDNPLATLSRYVERSLPWPGTDWHDGVARLADLAARHDLYRWVLFAGGDIEAQFIAHNHAALEAIFTLTTPAWDVLRWATDKRGMNTRAAELGLAIPSTRYPRSRHDLSDLGLRFPVVIKPTIHNAVVHPKAWRADDQRALAACYDQAEALLGSDRTMVQELIPGDGRTQFSYAGIWDRGAPAGAVVARRLRQFPIDFGFTSTLVETVELAEIADAACRFLRSLDYSGLVEIEFKHDARDGSYKILDVNVRAWTWIALGAAAGIDFPLAQWRLARGERIDVVPTRRGVRWRYLSRDLIAAAQHLLAGTLSPSACLRSLRHAEAGAVLAWDDPLPTALDLPLVAARVVMRRLRGGGRASTTALQSAKYRL